MINRTFDDTYTLLLNDTVSYEEASEAMRQSYIAMDLDWVEKTRERLRDLGDKLLPSANTTVLAYKQFAEELSAADLDESDPLGCLSEPYPMPVWAGPVASADYRLRAVAEAAILLASNLPYTQQLGEALLFYADRHDLVENYDRDVIMAALLDVASDAREDAIHQLGYLDFLGEDAADRPRAFLGKRPAYTVVHGDTLESVARAVLGSASRWMELVEVLGLHPPYFSQTPRGGALWPGLRILLDHDVASRDEVAAYGLSWALDIQPAPDGSSDYWDIYAGPNGMEEVAGLAALGTELGLRVTQPLGDWDDAEGELALYGVPTNFIGEKLKQGQINFDFALASSLVQDFRVASATPVYGAKQRSRGLVVREILVTPRRF